MDRQLNWTGKLAKYFIVNGKLTAILMIGLFIWGGFSFYQTPKKYNPTIVAPAFKITVQYPGASREEIVEQITKPLENVVTDIAGVEDVYSVSMKGGVAEIYANFYVGEDLNDAKVTLTDRLRSDFKHAPKGIQEPIIESLDPEDVPVMTLALSSQKVEEIELRRIGFQVRDRLSEVAGISRLNVIGGKQRELRIEVDPNKLSDYSISIQQISAALKDNNLFLPAGYLKGQKSYSQIYTDAWVPSVAEVKEIIVVTNNTINIKVKDLAKVYEAEKEVDYEIRHSKIGEELGNTVLLSLAKLKGTNITDVTNNVLKEIDKIKAENLPSDVKLDVLVNDGKTASDEIATLMSNLITSIVIVIAVLFLFLDVKASILVAISIPLTLASVFGVAFLAGQDINRITLFALILSLGLLVDNATVVIENIMRQVGEEKRTTFDTFAQAVSEVGIGLLMATITTVLAFIPMKFISGMMGPYMGPIPFFVPAALIAALLISYSINPWMASVIIKKDDNTPIESKKPSHASQLGTQFMLKYRHFLRNLMQHSKRGKTFIAMTVVALMIVLTFPLLKIVKFRMLPKANVDQFYLYVDLPNGASLSQSQEATKQLEETLKKDKNVTMIQSYIGTPPILDFNGLFKGVSSRQMPHQATIRVGILPDDQREETSEEIVLRLRPVLIKALVNFPGTSLKLIEDPPVPPVRSTLLVRVQSKDLDLLKKEAEALSLVVKEIDQTVDHDTSEPEEVQDISIEIDHFACSKSRISPGMIVDTINAYFSGRVLGAYHRKGLREQEFITLRIHKDHRKDLSLLNSLEIPNSMRINVPLSKVAKIEMAPAVPYLMRENHANTIYLSSEMGSRSVTYAGIDLLMRLFDYRLSSNKATLESWDLFGMHYKTENGKEVDITIGGEWELTLEVFRDLIIAMAVAMLAIYLVLVGQFKSFSDALLIMSTIPLSTIGIMPGFAFLGAIQGEYFTATSMIGVIALAGIAVNNAIIMLEYINQTKDKFESLIETLVEAAATRLRPIALTTITTVLGSLTIVSDPVWSGLAWSIIFGLGVSSTLILFIFPLLYHFLHKKNA